MGENIFTQFFNYLAIYRCNLLGAICEFFLVCFKYNIHIVLILLNLLYFDDKYN